MVSRYVSNYALSIGPGNTNGSHTTGQHVAQMPLGVAMAATSAAPSQQQQQQQSQNSNQIGIQQQQTQQQSTSQNLKAHNPNDYHIQQCIMQKHTPSTSSQTQHQHYRIVHPSEFITLFFCHY